jgi:hypothetical protein
MFTVEVNRGRLIEARVQGIKNEARALAYSEALADVVRRSRERMILCADHRQVVVYSQPVADRLAELFAQMNQRLERIAVLVARSNATLSLQLERIVREAHNPSRRVFYDAAGADAFLGEVLSVPERARLGIFLQP